MRLVTPARLFSLIAAVFAGGPLLDAEGPLGVPSGSPAAAPLAAHRVPRTRLAEEYGRLPLHFERNQGQVDSRVAFLARGSGYSLFLTPTEAVLALRDRSPHGPAVLRLTLAGANPRPSATGRDELPGKSNYFIGNDPAGWRTNIPTYARVHYSEVYPGVDLVYYGNQGRLEYDFVVAPGADTDRIRMSFDGARDIRIDERGDLILRVAGGDLRQRKPVVYQDVQGVRQEIAGRYVMKGKGRVAFELGTYDKRRPLVIDPVLVYATYLGGNFSDQGNDIAVDAAGSVYVTGETSSTNFPTLGAPYPTRSSNLDAFVTKLNSTGSALIYSTYLGGNGNDAGNGIAVDAAGNAYVVGTTAFTTPSNFPVTPGAFDTTLNAQDAFVAKLNATGSVLVYSTFLGGGQADAGNDVALDSALNVYVTGQTLSTGLTPFPTTAGAFQTGLNGTFNDAFVTKLNLAGSGLSDLVYSTYLGGGATESGNGIAVDAAGHAYVTGQTLSSGSTPFPTTAGALDLARDGSSDAFVTKLNLAGSGLSDLVYSTYLGGGGTERGNGVALDAALNVYVTGQTLSSGSTPFPTTAGAFQTGLNGTSNDAFVTKLNLAGSGLSDLVYSTYLGGGSTESGNGIAVDAAGHAFVTGQTLSSGSTSFPTTADALDLTRDGASDAFVTKLNLAGSGLSDLVYSTYLGGGGTESGNGIAVDAAGNLYVTGQTSSSSTAPAIPFPTTARAFDPSFNGGTQDAFVAKFGEALVPVLLTLDPPDATNPVSSQHCVTATVQGAGDTLVPGITVWFEVNANGAVAASGSEVTDANGQVDFCYTGPEHPRLDAVSAFADTDENGLQGSTEPGGTAAKTWVPDAPATLVLVPADATNPVATEHCVTATVIDSFGNPTPGITVRFSVTGTVSTTGSATTNAEGAVAFCYTSTTAGVDTISAFADTDGDGTQDDGTQDGGEPGGEATKIWVPGPPFSLTLAPATATNPVDAQHCVTASVKDLYRNATPGIAVRFSVAGAVNTSGSATTNPSGDAVFCYTALLPGADTITAYADTDTDHVKDEGEPTGTAAKTWVLPASTVGCKVTGGGNITTVNGARATFGGNAQSNKGLTRGNQEYQDHGPAQRRNVKSLNVLAVVCGSPAQATIFGQASVNGSGTLFYRIDVKDMGEPGRGRDSYSILLSDGYTSREQILDGGNIQIH